MAMKALYTINEGEKSLLASVQLWMSRLQLVMAVVSSTESNRSGFRRPNTSLDPPPLDCFLRVDRWLTPRSRRGLRPR